MSINVCSAESVPQPVRGISMTRTLVPLAPREREVLHLLSTGRPYKQIASELELSIGTVRTYIRRLYAKLRVHCRTEAVVKYLTHQLDN
jgi:DNA-binding NarL/FixJ family response regulator